MAESDATWREELADKYPLGSVIEVEPNTASKQPESYKTRVTDYSIIEQTPDKLYAEHALGPRVNCSTNPINFDPVENTIEISLAETVKPKRIIRVVKDE